MRAFLDMALDIVAAGIPPPGVTSNFTDPHSLYPYMIGTVVLCSVLTTGFTAARLWTKYLASNLAFEDCKIEQNSVKVERADPYLSVDILRLAWVGNTLLRHTYQTTKT